MQTLLNSYFLDYERADAPPPLLNGRDVMRAFHLKGGPEIGAILEALREAQVSGEVHTRDDALDWVRRYLDNAVRN